MSLNCKQIHKKLKTQPISSQSLPRLHLCSTKYPISKPKLNHQSSIFQKNLFNPELVLKKVSIKLQIAKRISLYGFHQKTQNNMENQIESSKKLIPYQIAAKKQFIKQTGLKQQKQKMLLDDNEIHITAQKWLIYDCQKKQVIKGFKYKKLHDIASISKIITFYTVFMIVKQFKLTIDKTQLIVMKEDEQINGTKVDLKEQAIVTLKDMLYALMLNSANNAATILANNLGYLVLTKRQGRYFSCYDVNQTNRRKNIQFFVSLMNKFVKKFQLNDTIITNPHGMAENMSSCQNVAIFFQECWKIQLFRKISSTKQKIIHQNVIDSQGKPLKIQIYLKNTNKLLQMNYACLGGKTGQNKIGGNNFVGIFQSEHNNKCILVVFGCFGRQQKFRDTEKLYHWLISSRK